MSIFTAFSSVFKSVQNYEKFFLLRHSDVWQSRLHIILPAGAISSLAILFLAFGIPARFTDSLLPVDQIVYPLLFLASILSVFWLRRQIRAECLYAAPTRTRLIKDMLVRLVCLVFIFLPPITISECLRFRAQRIMSAQDLAASFWSLSKALDSCSASRKAHIPAPLLECINRGREKDLNLPLECQGVLSYLIAHKEIGAEGVRLSTTTEQFHEYMLFLIRSGPNLSGWDVSVSPDDELSKVVIETAANWLANNCLSSDSNDTVSLLLWAYLWQSNQIIDIGYGDRIPRRNIRCLIFILTIFCISVPYNLRWAGWRLTFQGIGAVVGCVLLTSYLWSMGWLSWFFIHFGYGPLAGEDAIRMVAWSIVGISALPILLLPLHAHTRVRQVYSFLASAALSISLIFPFIVLWLYHPWYWQSTDPFSILAVVVGGFISKPDEWLSAMELPTYAFGLAYCFFSIALLGPAMHRSWAAPK